MYTIIALLLFFVLGMAAERKFAPRFTISLKQISFSYKQGAGNRVEVKIFPQ